MAKISTYDKVTTVGVNDFLIGTIAHANDETKSFEVDKILQLLPSIILTLPVYASNAAAITGGLIAGQLYRIAGAVSIVV